MLDASKTAQNPPRVVLYMRVSTGPQAQRDLSIPDQKREMKKYCEARGWQIAGEFIDAKTGRDDRRPGFQEMMDQVMSGALKVEIILVHSLSRFFRDAIELELRVRQLNKLGVSLVSITQEFDEEDSAAQLARRIFTLFDEFTSVETAKHVSRSLRENARQGFWCGSKPPFGYRLVEAGRRGDRVKKRLAIEPIEADVVRLIFDLYLKGDGQSGPLGVKGVTSWLNDHGYRTRKDARWGVGPIHRILADTAYKGEFLYNRNGKPEDRVLVDVPAIISPSVFDATQNTLRQRNRTCMAPRLVNGPTLLTGLATCAICGNKMMLRTGKSGKYRYYTCGGHARQGKSTCPGRSVPMEELDRRVLELVVGKVVTPERAERLLDSLLERQNAQRQLQEGSLAALEDKLDTAETSLRRLYDLVAQGLVDASDPTLKERIDIARAERDIAQAHMESARTRLAAKTVVTPEMVNWFVEVLLEQVLNGPPEFRRAYVHALVDTIVIAEGRIEIVGKDHRTGGRGFPGPARRKGRDSSER